MILILFFLLAERFEQASVYLFLHKELSVTCNAFFCVCLEWVPGEKSFFVVSPEDILSAKPRTEEDHVNWLVSRNNFEVSDSGEQLQREILLLIA